MRIAKASFNPDVLPSTESSGCALAAGFGLCRGNQQLSRTTLSSTTSYATKRRVPERLLEMSLILFVILIVGGMSYLVR
jgi:hypothetical protein